MMEAMHFVEVEPVVSGAGYLDGELSVPLKKNGGIDLYSIHQSVTRLLDGQPSENGYAYSPLRVEGSRMQVLLRRMADNINPLVSENVENVMQLSGDAAISWRRRWLQEGDRLDMRCAARFVRQTASGERTLRPDEARVRMVMAMQGFRVEAINSEDRAIEFSKKGKTLCLPFWAFTLTATVIDERLAAKTMVHGVGRSRGLGFGMLVDVS